MSMKINEGNFKIQKKVLKIDKVVKASKITRKKVRVLKRNVKDSVFTDLFKNKKYSLELYKALHPEDKNVTIEDLKIYDSKLVLVNDYYNDLAFGVRNRIIILMEEQSSWSINILIRDLLYLVYVYEKIFVKHKVNLYGSKKIDIPMPELYVLYTGKKKIEAKEISLNEEYFDGKAPIDLRVKIITKAEKNSILYEYIKFNEMTDNLIKKYGYTKKTAEKIVNTCIKKNILKEYLTDRKKEVVDIMDVLFNQDWVTEVYENEIYEEGKAEGIQQGKAEGIQQGKAEGIQQGNLAAILNMFKKGFIKIADAASELGMSEREFMKLAKS